MFDRLQHNMWCVIRNTLHTHYMKHVVGNEKQYIFNMDLWQNQIMNLNVRDYKIRQFLKFKEIVANFKQFRLVCNLDTKVFPRLRVSRFDAELQNSSIS
jgi:hypothetical protein